MSTGLQNVENPRLNDAVRPSARSAVDAAHDNMASVLEITRCRNGFVVEATGHSRTADGRCVVTSLDDLLDVVRKEFTQ